jgi:signal transduction protein with GAF and PtsI domain
MDDQPPPGDDLDLEAARATIARQAREIAELRRQVDAGPFARDLTEALMIASATGTIAAPVSHARLLDLIVETAAHVISAESAALFLLDDEAQELVFEVALGPHAPAVKHFRVPLGHGIAGLVAVSGQPMAISDAGSDPRQAADIARSIGYVPRSIVCVPLVHNDRVTGVLELLDKRGAASFSAADMEALGLFANQAAVAIETSRTTRNLAGLVAEIVASLPGERDAAGRDAARRYAEGVEANESFRGAVELAALVQEIVWRGERERSACVTLLEGFAAYLRSQPTFDGYGGIG